MNRRNFFATITGALLAGSRAIAKAVKPKPPTPFSLNPHPIQREILFGSGGNKIFGYCPTGGRCAGSLSFVLGGADEMGPITATEYSLVQSRVPGGRLLANPQSLGEGWARKRYMAAGPSPIRGVEEKETERR